MKKRLFLSGMVLFFLFSVSVYAQKQEIYTEHSPPANFKDKNGAYAGKAVDLVREIQKRVGSKEQIMMIPWVRAYFYITDPGKTNIVLFSMTFTEKRRNLFKWVGPVAENSWQLFARADSDIVINTLEDAKKVNVIGTYRGDVRETFLKSKGFKNLDSTTNNIQNLHKLLYGRITLWMVSNTGAVKMTQLEGIPFNQIKLVYTIEKKGLYIAFHKNTSDTVVMKWQLAYEDIKKDGTMERIFKKWKSAVPTHIIPPPP